MNKKIIIIAVIVIAAALIAYMVSQEFKTAAPAGDEAPQSSSAAVSTPQTGENEADRIASELSSKSRSAFLSKEYRVKCSPCHNKDGTGPLGVTISGQSKEELMKKLRAYKNGEKENNLMSNLIKSISDEEMERLADEISHFPNPDGEQKQP